MGEKEKENLLKKTRGLRPHSKGKGKGKGKPPKKGSKGPKGPKGGKKLRHLDDSADGIKDRRGEMINIYKSDVVSGETRTKNRKMKNRKTKNRKTKKRNSSKKRRR